MTVRHQAWRQCLQSPRDEAGRDVGADILQDLKVPVCHTARVGDHRGNDTFAARRVERPSGLAVNVFDRGDDFRISAVGFIKGSSFPTRCRFP